MPRMSVPMPEPLTVVNAPAEEFEPAPSKGRNPSIAVTGAIALWSTCGLISCSDPEITNAPLEEEQDAMLGKLPPDIPEERRSQILDAPPSTLLDAEHSEAVAPEPVSAQVPSLTATEPVASPTAAAPSSPVVAVDVSPPAQHSQPQPSQIQSIPSPSASKGDFFSCFI